MNILNRNIDLLYVVFLPSQMIETKKTELEVESKSKKSKSPDKIWKEEVKQTGMSLGELRNTIEKILLQHGLAITLAIKIMFVINLLGIYWEIFRACKYVRKKVQYPRLYCFLSNWTTFSLQGIALFMDKNCISDEKGREIVLVYLQRGGARYVHVTRVTLEIQGGGEHIRRRKAWYGNRILSGNFYDLFWISCCL